MPKNNGLKLFTKTWSLKRDKRSKEEELTRPLTATLEKPTILDIRFIGKIDMSRVRKEFLNISNLCRMPLVIKQKRSIHRPLSILGPEMHRKPKKKRKKLEPNDDSHEDDESSVVQSAKINIYKNGRNSSRNSGRLSGNNNSVINRLKQNSVLQIKNSINDANNNKTLKVPSRKPLLTTIPTPIVPIPSPDPVKSSTKLPSPCRTCGRPDLPERFHSHPATPLKPSPRNTSGIASPVALDKIEKLPVKSTVQKPIAIKYQSKNGSAGTTRNISPLKKRSNQASSLPIPTVKKPATKPANKIKESTVAYSELTVRIPSAVSETEATMNGGNITPLRGGSGKRTLTCYICGREFGTASLRLHEPKCLDKWERENASLPSNMRRRPPVKPDGSVSQKEWNQLAWEASQAALVSCNNCGRTFYPDRLVVHQRSCKVQSNNTKKVSSNDTLSSTSSSPMSQRSDPPSSSTSAKAHQPPSVQCYICGRMFGTHSIAIHEKKCLKKWHAENESLPPDMRSPAPTKSATTQNRPPPSSPPTSSAATTPKSSKEERPISGTKSPLFPCYLCGKLFTVNSIYIHEPQCLKMWKIENDKLPPNKRRPVPLKPDIKFTRSGKINFEETSDAYWQSHISQLVPCKLCSRTFNPDRINVHERSCKGN